MGARRKNAIHSAGGRLAYGVTDRTANGGVFPYDGTELGLVSSVYVIPPNGVYYLQCEEDGSTVRAVYVGGDAVAGVQIANWDADILGALYPGHTTGLDAGEAVLFPSAVGQTVTPLSNLYYEADNSEHLSWLMPLAIPEIEESERIWFSHYRRQYFPAIFRSQASESGVAIMFGKAADLLGSNESLDDTPGVTNLAADDGIEGTADIVLTWDLPAARDDQTGVMVRRAAGATAPATTEDGTEVYNGALVSTLDDDPAEGTWSYAVFVAYTGGRASDPADVTAEMEVDPLSAAAVAALFGADLVADWDARAGVAGVAAISAWVDQHAGLSAAQATGSAQPALLTDGSDRPFVRLAPGDYLRLAPAPADLTTYPACALAVFGASTGSQGLVFALVDGANSEVWGLQVDPSGGVVQTDGGAPAAAVSGVDFAYVHAAYSRVEAASYGATVDQGTEATTAAAADLASAAALEIGFHISLSSTVDVYRLIFLSAVPTPAQLATFWEGAETGYGVTLP